MKKLIFALFSMMLIAISCKKSDPDPVAPTNQPYANLNNGTNWIYEVKNTDQASGTTTTTQDTSHVADPDTTIGSKSYARVIHNDGTHTYYNISGNDYYRFQRITIPSVLDTSIEVLYLKDNGSVGTSWSQVLNVAAPGVPITIPLTFTSSIDSVGITMAVNGTTYNDVIKVGTAVSLPATTGISITSNIANYYARNVGLIKGNYDIELSAGLGGIHTQTELKFADIH